MAHIAIAASINPSGIAAAHRTDPQGAVVNAAADEAAINTDLTAVDADITAAIANVTIAGNAPALALVNQIEADFDTLQADVATMIADLAAGGVTASPVLLSYDPAAVVSKNQLVACVNAIMRVVKGASDLT